MGMSTGGRGGVQAEINVTPLIDVCLVLLVIFIVVTPMMNSKSGVELPQAPRPAETKDPKRSLVASVDRNRVLRIGDDPVGRKEAVERLRETLERKTADRLTVEADRSLTFGDVLPLLEASNEAGFHEANLAARPQAKGAK